MTIGSLNWEKISYMHNDLSSHILNSLPHWAVATVPDSLLGIFQAWWQLSLCWHLLNNNRYFFLIWYDVLQQHSSDRCCCNNPGLHPEQLLIDLRDSNENITISPFFSQRICGWGLPPATQDMVYSLVRSFSVLLMCSTHSGNAANEQNQSYRIMLETLQ